MIPPIDLSLEDWHEVLHILQKHVPHLQVWAFGSRARRTAKPYSDLDLALITQTPLLLEERAMLADAFDESTLPIRVDLVDWATTSENFRKIITQDKVMIQQSIKKEDP
ncbi:MAG: nucleotidyltransferase domain-containing protein [Gammaproteobacteria bacterium]|jgi:predicted nucleotidyltransferase|nr:nucleotidyltransferase domain-containing protein [Gammaproteobacteria bacterium]